MQKLALKTEIGGHLHYPRPSVLNARLRNHAQHGASLCQAGPSRSEREEESHREDWCTLILEQSYLPPAANLAEAAVMSIAVTVRYEGCSVVPTGHAPLRLRPILVDCCTDRKTSAKSCCTFGGAQPAATGPRARDSAMQASSVEVR